MKLHRKEYPKIRERVKRGKSYFEVDMRRKGLVGRQYRTFTQLKDARKYVYQGLVTFWALSLKGHDNNYTIRPESRQCRPSPIRRSD